MGEPAVLPGTTHYEGDRWLDGYRHFGPVSVDGSPLANQCLYAELRFVNQTRKNSGYTLTSSAQQGQGRLTIVDPINYRFEIAQTEDRLPLGAGEWLWALVTYRTADKSTPPLTLWRGSITIIPKV